LQHSEVLVHHRDTEVTEASRCNEGYEPGWPALRAARQLSCQELRFPLVDGWQILRPTPAESDRVSDLRL
jgi:hypothetical protein